MPLSARPLRRSQPVEPRAATLLVVSADQAHRSLVCRHFEAHGSLVHEVGTGTAAVAVLVQHPCDVVLLDLTTATATGLEVLTAIRHSEAGCDVPVIVVTPDGAPGVIDDALDLGADDYLTAPLDASGARARVRAQLARAAGGSALPRRAAAPPLGPVVAPSAAGDHSAAAVGTALLAEDDHEVRLFVRDLLEAEGYTVVDTARGDLALDAAHRLGTIDLLVTDLHMPGMGGMALWTALHAARPTLPAVFMSGHDTQVVTRPASLPVLQKPFTTNDFLAAVRRARRTVAALPAAAAPRDPASIHENQASAIRADFTGVLAKTQ